MLSKKIVANEERQYQGERMKEERLDAKGSIAKERWRVARMVQLQDERGGENGNEEDGSDVCVVISFEPYLDIFLFNFGNYLSLN